MLLRKKNFKWNTLGLFPLMLTVATFALGGKAYFILSSLLSPAFAQQAQTVKKDTPPSEPKTKSKDSTQKTHVKDFDPLTLTADEIDVLQTLHKRREELESREQKLSTDETTLRSIRTKIEEDLKLLSEVETRINKILAKYSKDQKEKIIRLTKLYSQMKPKQAASIFETLEADIAVEILDGLNEKNAANILDKMAPDKAQKLLEAVINKQRKELFELFPTAKASCEATTKAKVAVAKFDNEAPPPLIDEFAPTPDEEAPPPATPALAQTTVKPPA